MTKYLLFILLAAASFQALHPQFHIARLKYNGGGDWYNDPSADVNLMRFVTQETGIPAKSEFIFTDIATDAIFAHPFLFMTGHGTISFSADEAARLRKYLENGGFLYVDDDYGMDKSFRREIAKVLPGAQLLELPYSHPLFTIFFDFSSGPPKTHKHDEQPPQVFGIFLGERLAVLYTYEMNPSDGWTDAIVHNNPEEKRLEALKFGTNIVLFALSQMPPKGS